LLTALVIVDVLIATEATGYPAFGAGAWPTMVILIMFGAILLGTAARYVFHFQARFSWLGFAKPLCISPICCFPSWLSPGGKEFPAYASGLFCVAGFSERLLLAGGVGTLAAEALTELAA
jgi:hypothetical protein